MAKLLSSKFLNEISAHISHFIPDEKNIPKGDIDKAVQLATQAALAKLDLVTREEFDIQCAVLARTRAHVTELEARLDELEQSNPPVTRP